MTMHPRDLVRRAGGLALARVPIDYWPGALQRVYGIGVPRAVQALPEPAPRGNANVRIVLELLRETSHVEGTIAECGVFRGATLVPTVVDAVRRDRGRRAIAFDSFQGFGPEVEVDIALGGSDDGSKRPGGFSDTSVALVRRKLSWFGVDGNVTIADGSFADTLDDFRDERFAFVHLDCDLYDSYRMCLEFFYPRLSAGGIILFDEYNDPAWPGCTRAVDEFLGSSAVPEKLQTIERDNYTRSYFVKQ